MWRQIPIIGSLGTAASPERWLLPAALVGWSVLGVIGGTGMAMSMASGTLPQATPMAAIPYFAAQVAMTLLMLPFLANTLRHVRRRSFEWRQRRSMAIAAMGYFSVWLLGNMAISVTILLLHAARIGVCSAASLAFILAAVWQLMPQKRVSLTACHRQFPLEPTGLRADVSCLRQGASNGFYCWLSCGLMMLAAMLSPYPLVALMGVLLLICYERYDRRSPRRETALALMGAAIVTTALPLLVAI